MLKSSMFFQFLLVICSNFGYAQKTSPYEILRTRLQNADSVVLISHILTKEYTKQVYDWDTNDTIGLKNKNSMLPGSYAFVLKGRINPAIIIEAEKITTNKSVLIDILASPSKSENGNLISCDMPQHSIIIYKNGRQSYLDLCFTCKKVHPSMDIKLSEKDFDENKWERLKLFFQNEGIKEKFLP